MFFYVKLRNVNLRNVNLRKNMPKTTTVRESAYLNVQINLFP